MLFKKRFFVSLIFFILILLTRFLGINWGQTFAFHPDENNMVSSVLQMNSQNLNPNFFAYGQFPLYLTYFTTPVHDFQTITLTLRFWSAIFSCLSLYFFYLIGLKIFESQKQTFIFILLLIFTPGLIQTAHFGTTESILIFVFAANIFLSFKIYDSPKKIIYLFISGLISGIGLASKISSLILTFPIFLSLFFLLLKKTNLWRIISYSTLFLLFSILIGIIFSPYSLINFPEFLSSMKYEIGVASGQIPVFYTRQFIDTLPYVFQFQKIFPYTNGLFVYIFGILGFVSLTKSFFKKHKSNPYLLLILFSSLVYFIYQGQLFVKWTRFMAPIFFIFPFLSIFLIQKIKNKILIYLFILLSIAPGVYFLKTYFYQDTRIQATEWINQNISQNNCALSESGNVINLPLYKSNINVVNFDFYNLDESLSLPRELEKTINNCNYIFVPSRRVFKNQNNPHFPQSQQYYQSLFSGDLDFNQIKKFSLSNSLFLNSENAEETWSVFDSPVVRIYSRHYEN